MNARIMTSLILLTVVFAPAGIFFSMTVNFQVIALPVSDFPIEQYIWERTGPLIHYDWGLAAYIYLHNNNFYYMIVGGSEFYAVWISLDPNDSDGFQINGMSVDYVLSTVGPVDRTSSSAGLHKWVASEENWEPIVIANMTEYDQSGVVYYSSDGSVAFSANQGKIALSKIGNPDRIWLVLEATETGSIRVPQNGFAYLDLTNMFAAVFMVHKDIGPIAHPGRAFPPEPDSWVINRLETANATIFLKNYGTSSIQNVDVNISVPLEVEVLNGTVTWSTSIGPDQNETHAVQINRTSFGTSFLEASLIYEVGETGTMGPITLPQKLTLIPRISLDITAPQETLLWMQDYQVNLTIANLDPYAATVDLKPSRLAYTQERDVITLTVNPLANMTLHPRVKIKGSSVGYAAFFEEIELDWATASVDFTYPDIWISGVFIDNEQYTLGYVDLDVGKMHEVQCPIRNEENVAYSVTIVLKEGAYSQELSPEDAHVAPYYSAQTVELLPSSNTTITFHVLALDTPETDKYTTLSLGIEIDQTHLRHTEVAIKLISQPEPFLTPEIILIWILLFFAGISAKIIYDVVTRKAEPGKK